MPQLTARVARREPARANAVLPGESDFLTDFTLPLISINLPPTSWQVAVSQRRALPLNESRHCTATQGAPCLDREALFLLRHEEERSSVRGRSLQ